MNKKPVIVLASCLGLAVHVVHGGEAGPAADPHASLPAGHPSLAAPAAATAAAPPESESFAGKVLETTNAASYTYVLVDTGTRRLWAAAPRCEVKVGDAVAVPQAWPVPEYHSRALNRDFDLVFFAGELLVGGAKASAPGPRATMPEGHPPIRAGVSDSKIDFSGIKSPEGGKTIAQVFAEKAALRGKSVQVRGKVVKFNPGVMGKNWLHIRDGTGAEGSNDLTLTTTAAAKVGDTILVTGTVAIDKDFGHGYKYAVILENAKLVVE